MRKTNYFASIYKDGKKLARRRVYEEELDWNNEPRAERGQPREYVHFQEQLWDVDKMIDNGYTLLYTFIPNRFGAYNILDIALSQPFKRERRRTE